MSSGCSRVLPGCTRITPVTHSDIAGEKIKVFAVTFLHLLHGVSDADRRKKRSHSYKRRSAFTPVRALAPVVADPDLHRFVALRVFSINASIVVCVDRDVQPSDHDPWVQQQICRCGSRRRFARHSLLMVRHQDVCRSHGCVDIHEDASFG
jgi:hypothetical protein